MLSIKNLSVKVSQKEVLKDFNLDIDDGRVHVVMGPNGVGKSTLSRTIMGDSNYQVTSGKIIFNNEDITKMTTDSRSRLGIFLAMQSPLEIDGLGEKFAHVHDFVHRIVLVVGEIVGIEAVHDNLLELLALAVIDKDLVGASHVAAVPDLADLAGGVVDFFIGFAGAEGHGHKRHHEKRKQVFFHIAQFF